jgi:hypothetical protein
MVREACGENSGFQFLQKPFQLLELKACLSGRMALQGSAPIAR